MTSWPDLILRDSYQPAKTLTCHREPPLGGVAIQGCKLGAAALDCFVAALLAMTVGQ
jgi:hypothetical protein